MIAYTLRRSTRAKHLRIAIHPDGEVIVTLPHRKSELLARRFVEEKKTWIESKVALMKRRLERIDGLSIPKNSRKDYLEQKENALKLVQKRLHHFNAHYGLKWNLISIKMTSSRWGSCSKKGNLNFSYRIVFLPQELADYLVVHELCHLKEFNHSRAFWNLVGQAIPEYTRLRKEIRVL